MNVEFVLKGDAVLEFEGVSDWGQEDRFVRFLTSDKVHQHINLDYVVSFTIFHPKESFE